MPSYGQQNIGPASGQPTSVVADGDYRFAKPGGVTIDWSTITAVGSDTVLADNTTVLAGGKYLRYGQILTQITATGKFGPYAGGATGVVAAPASPPVPTASGADGTLAAGVYQVAYTFTNADGETTASPAAPVTVGATNHISVATITLPTGITGLNIYISAGPGDSDVVKAVYTGTGPYVITAPPAVGAARPPATNTANATLDGRENLVRGACYIVDRTVLQTSPYLLVVTASDHPSVIEGGLLWKARLLVGGAGQPSWAAFEAAFPNVRYAQ